MVKKVIDNIKFRDAQIIFRNFSGKEGKFNPAGKRNFSVIIEDSEFAKILQKDGWNVRFFEQTEDNPEPSAHLQVAIGDSSRIIIVTKNNKTELTRNELNFLDWCDIDYVDLDVRPYNWEVGDKYGVKAYVKKMFINIIEDDLDEKYANVDVLIEEE